MQVAPPKSTSIVGVVAKLGRREFLKAAGLLGAAGGIAGCTSDGSRDSAGGLGPTRSTSASPSAGRSSVALPNPRPWSPSTYDVSPGVKARAVGLVETAATWEPGDGGSDNGRRRLTEAGYAGDLVDDLGPVLGAGVAAVAHVVVAQYGGILDDSASVLVVVDQWVLHEDDGVQSRGTTLDIRLVVDKPQWRVTAVRPARPGRDIVELSRPARRLLASDRVTLPQAAASDIRAGEINDVVLDALLSLSVLHQLDVSILRSGHPLMVFGTDRVSNHTEGLAVDIWALDRRPVIDSGDSPSVADFMKAAVDVGAYQVGGPTDPDGAGETYFSDDTHEDHIHLGFTT